MRLSLDELAMPQAIWQYERSLVENDAQTGLRILSFMFLLYNFYLYKIIYTISSRISCRVKSPRMTSKRPRYGAGTCCRLFAAACGRKEEAVRRRDQENRAYSAAGGFPGMSHDEKNWRI